ncbi:TOBE domain-containing protein [Aquimarina longa]|uniref:TOBE domain-containing protein n=1 Tax=Aquimarina longa TaxID=1080221 RepID=UPI0007867ECA|nr:TOBE domain-containing protein [Aquimarina longa]
MNSIKGEIVTIQTNGSLSLVTIDSNGIFFSAIIIETPNTASYLKIGNQIKMIFKETEVIIDKNPKPTISIQNRVLGKILTITKGELLSKLTIDTMVGQLTAIITSDALYKLQLEVGNTVTTMIKTTEIMLSE